MDSCILTIAPGDSLGLQGGTSLWFEEELLSQT